MLTPEFLTPHHLVRDHVPLRNTAAKDGWPTVEGAATTLYEVFEQSVKRYGDSKCLGWRPIVDGKAGPYEYWTYKETRGAY